MMRSRFERLLLTLTLMLSASAALAGSSDLVVHIGPPQVGSGGDNPVAIPPIDPYDYEVEYVTQGDWESCLSLAPGALFGKRSREGNIYVSIGGGLVRDANGYGPGIYSALGYEAGKGVKFNAELKQTLGYDFKANVALSPYAFRIGVAFDL